MMKLRVAAQIIFFFLTELAMFFISARVRVHLNVFYGLSELLLLVEGCRPVGGRPGQRLALQQHRVTGSVAHGLGVQQDSKLVPTE